LNRFFNYGYHLFQAPTIFSKQWRSPKSIEKHQDRLLQKLVKHAYANVAYYRKLFDDTGIAPEDIRTTRDLIRIPILNKDAILDNFP
jgi:phenylacetate-CoA ligase